MLAFQQNERPEAKMGLHPGRPPGPARLVPVSQQNERLEARTGIDPGRPLGPARIAPVSLLIIIELLIDY